MVLHRLGEDLAQLFRLGFKALLAGSLEPVIGVLLHLLDAVFVHNHVVGGFQCPDLGGDGAGLGDVLEGEVMLEQAGIHPEAAHGLVKEERLHLRSEDDTAFTLPVIHGLDAEGIPAHKGGFLLSVIDHDGEHTPKHGDEGLAILAVQGHDDLDLRVGMEGDALLHQRLAEIPVVVDLAVEDSGKPPVRGGIGLGAGVQVDDGEPAEGHTEAVPDQVVAFIRATVPDGVGHPGQQSFIIQGRIPIKHSYKSAQSRFAPFGQ